MNIKNYTAHTIFFYREEDVNYVSEVRKHVVKEGAEPYLEVPSIGMLSVAFENDKVSDIPVPVYTKSVLRLDRLPALESPDDMVVVSALYASYRKVTDTLTYPLYSVKDVVYGKSGVPVGCLGLLVVK